MSRSASFDPARSGDEWRFFATVGRAARSRAGFALTVLACGLGVFRELLRPASWHRPVRAELRRSLSQAVGGGLVTTIVAGGLVGIAMVYEALFWLGEVGEERLVGSILVRIQYYMLDAATQRVFSNAVTLTETRVTPALERWHHG